MTAVRYHVPANRLSQLIRKPGGLPVAEAMEGAQARLNELAAPAREALEAGLQAAEACTARLPAQFDPAAAAELYEIAQGAIGLASLCERPAIDVALHSLCDLLDHFGAHERWDPEAIAVHVRAFRLLMGEAGTEDGAGAEAVMQGLRRVSRRYATPGETGA